MQIVWPIVIIAALGLVAGLGLALAAKFLGGDTDKRLEDIRNCLPGANCGSCGFAGCDDYAAAIAKGTAQANLCVPGGSVTAEALSEVLGAKIESKTYVARVACNANCEKTKTDHLYCGVTSCAAANMMFGGPLSCKFGCIGLGDCAAVCENNGITVQNGCSTVNEDLCVGCRRCEKVCPKHIIKIVERHDTPFVLCSNTNKGAATRSVCTAGCIGCKMCEKVCESGAIKVVDNLAHIDELLCTNCKKCVEKCPQKCIK